MATIIHSSHDLTFGNRNKSADPDKIVKEENDLKHLASDFNVSGHSLLLCTAGFSSFVV